MSCARRARGTGMALQLAAATAALVTQVAGEGCGLQGGLCICEDSDGDRWDLTPLGGDHIVSGPVRSPCALSEFNEPLPPPSLPPPSLPPPPRLTPRPSPAGAGAVDLAL